MTEDISEVGFSLSLSSETVIDNVDLLFYLKFSWIYQIT